MKRVLITGGAGFIGSHLCERLADTGCDVVVLDDLSSGRAENLDRVAPERVTLLRGDVRDVARYSGQLGRVDTIFHLAALISGYDSLSQPEAYLDVNVRGTLEVLKLCERLERPRVVFASSSTVYGPHGTDAARSELDVPRPASVYALSKLAGEHLLDMYADVYGFEPVSLRLFNVYGPRQSPSHPYANVTCKFSHAAAHGLPVKLYGDGEQSRDFVYVDDVVEALVRVATGARERVYNVGTGADTTILDLLHAAQALAVRPMEVERLPPWPNDIRRIRADTSRLAREHGVTAKVGFREGLARTVEWFRGSGLGAP